MKSKDVNKVVLSLGGRPMILYAIKLLESLKISPIIAVVGFAKKSVIDVLKDRVVYVEQKKRLGTAHAVAQGLKKLDGNVEDVLVVNGDDSAFYKKETLENLIKTHLQKDSSITFLTIDISNLSGMARVIRDANNKVIAVVEDKDSSEEQKKIKEVNSGCYVFDLDFLHKYLKTIEKSKKTREYYLTRLIDIAVKKNQRVIAVKGGPILWRGINTMEELREAERMFLQAR